MLPAMLASRNKVIYRYWLLSSDFCKTSWIFLHDPVCPKTGPVLSKKPGPFCPEAWSVLSWNVVRFVLRRGPLCPETWSVLSGPFCPWSVLSVYQVARIMFNINKFCTERNNWSNWLVSLSSKAYFFEDKMTKY